MLAAYRAGRGDTISHEGGEVFRVSDMQRLERFLNLGAIGGTFYASQQEFAQKTLDQVKAIIEREGRAAVDMIVDVGQNAPKHEHVLVAFAMALSVEDRNVRAYALSRFSEVVRTGTHLFHVIAYTKGRRGWGMGFRKAIGRWYLDRSPMSLANQLIKYQQRDGWSHRDVLRKAHPRSNDPSVNAMLGYAVSGSLVQDDSKAHEWLGAAIECLHAESVEQVLRLLREYALPREVVPTQFQSDPRVWEALLPGLGQTALMRNIRNMTSSGFLVQGSDAERDVVARIDDADALRRGRIHPVQVFLAKAAASRDRQGNRVDVPQSVQNALERAFYSSFDTLEGTDRRVMLAIDVSSSMSWSMDNLSGISAAEWSAVMAMVTLRQSPFAEVYGFSHRFVDLGIDASDSLGEVMRKTSDQNFGATDCSLPMRYAREQSKRFDAFCVYTDSETWGFENVDDELRRYREKSGIHDAKLSVVASVANEITIGNPNDANILNICGMSIAAPKVMERFINR